MTSYRQPTGAGPLIQWQQQKLAIPAAALLAAEKQRAGQWQAAEGIYQAMLRVLPAAAELHNNLGVIRLLANRPAEALTSFERALSLKPEYANAHFNRGCALRSLGRRPEALLSFQQAVKYQPGHIQALNNSGALLQAMRQYDQALATYKMSLAVNPVNPDAWNNCGIIHLQAGRLPEAEAHFAKAVEQNPDFAAAWFHLAGMRCYAATAYPDAAILQERLKKTGWPEETLEYFHFALGKIHDDRGQYAAAFSHYQTANQLRRRQAVYHRETAEAQTAAVLGQSHQPPAAPCAATPVQPLFIVGMPRSGTTLINQILSHHPAIGSAGEMATLPELAEKWNPASPLTDTQAAEFRTRYLTQLVQRSRPDTRFIIDKNPLNFTHLGLIRQLFPQAPIIHCERHPWDTSLSIYFQRFPLTLSYAFDLDDIGHFFAQYQQRMAHWRQTLPGIIPVSYEATVQTPENTIREMLAALGLPWDSRCTSPHTNPEIVETASQWQVRQPMHGQAIGRWKNYQRELAPLAPWLGAP